MDQPHVGAIGVGGLELADAATIDVIHERQASRVDAEIDRDAIHLIGDHALAGGSVGPQVEHDQRAQCFTITAGDTACLDHVWIAQKGDMSFVGRHHQSPGGLRVELTCGRPHGFANRAVRGCAGSGATEANQDRNGDHGFHLLSSSPFSGA